MANFSEILNKKSTDVEKPKPKPKGFYVSMVNGLPKTRKINANGEEREILGFSLKPLSVHSIDPDDQEALDAQPPIQSWPAQTKDFWDDEQGEWNLKQFLTNNLGIDPGPPNKPKTLGEMIADAPGKQLITEYENYPFQNKSTGEMEIGTRIKSTAAL